MTSPHQLRPATLDDAPMLARLHVQAWAETYPGILPPEEIARRTYAIRLAQWIAQINAGSTRIFTIPDYGFVQFGPQRDEALTAQGYAEELYALYLLQAGQGQGMGRALFDAGWAEAAFTCMVLDGNLRACRFYERTGARLLRTFDDHIGETPTRERLYGWPAPITKIDPAPHQS